MNIFVLNLIKQTLLISMLCTGGLGIILLNFSCTPGYAILMLMWLVFGDVNCAMRKWVRWMLRVDALCLFGSVLFMLGIPLRLVIWATLSLPASVYLVGIFQLLCALDNPRVTPATQRGVQEWKKHAQFDCCLSSSSSRRVQYSSQTRTKKNKNSKKIHHNHCPLR